MTGRPSRDLHDEAKRAFARRLAHEGCRVPDLLATELLAILAGHRIGLTDTSRPANPDADALHPTTPAAPDSPARAQYHAARQALKGTQP